MSNILCSQNLLPENSGEVANLFPSISLESTPKKLLAFGETVHSMRFFECSLLVSSTGEPGSPLLVFHSLPIEYTYFWGKHSKFLSCTNYVSPFFDVVNYSLLGPSPWILCVSKEKALGNPIQYYLNMVTSPPYQKGFSESGWDLGEISRIRTLPFNLGKEVDYFDTKVVNDGYVTVAISEHLNSAPNHEYILSIDSLTGNFL